MDPFNKLPAEIRVHIYLQLRLCSKRSVLSIVQASPAMLNQYMTSRTYIVKTSLTSDLDEEMIQDATRIILFPSWKTTIVSFKVPGDLYRSWTAPQLPNPFKTEDHALIAKMDKLHSRLLLFIEDYLTKATAVFPPREYLCLPDLSSIQGHLIFKGEIVSPRFDATHLTIQERKRLLRTFLRHELICKVTAPETGRFSELNWGPLQEYGGRMFQLSDREAVYCVHMYLVSLYGAVFAQCSESWLPDIPKGTLSSHNTGLLYPDNLYVDVHSYASDMAACVSSSPASFGFDLVTVLLRSATSGRHGLDNLKLCLKTGFLEKWFCNGWSEHHIIDLYQDLDYQEGSSMYQTLLPRIEAGLLLQQDIYRQRAWVFLDDARLYPSSGLAPHFPTSDELVEQCSDTATCEKWFTNPHATRAWHRTQQCHEKQRPSGADDQVVNKPQDPRLEKEYQAPPLSRRSAQQEDSFRRFALARFWQSECP